MKIFFGRLGSCVKQALPKAMHISVWLLKIVLPVSLVVRLMQYYGIITILADYLHPLFNFIGLPGATAIVFITSIFLPLYGTIAVMTSLSMTMREATILTLMCLVAHSLLVECAVMKKTGSSFIKMILLRIGMAFVVAMFLNAVLPVNNTPFMMVMHQEQYDSIGMLLLGWIESSTMLILIIMLIITALMILQRILIEFNLIEYISRPLRPLMIFFGLPDKAPFFWLVGNVVGLAYGSAVMIDMVQEGKLSLKESNDLNHHLAISHSLLEDTLLFAALGINIWVIMGTRVSFAMAVVWGRKLFTTVFNR